MQIDYTVAKEKMFVEHSTCLDNKTLRRHFEVCGESITNKFELRGGRVLDIGGNDGTFLEYFVKNGHSVLNVESGRNQAKASREKAVETENCFFNFESALDIKKKFGPMRVIHGSGVLFHLEELHSVFRGIETLLDTDGVGSRIYLPSRND